MNAALRRSVGYTSASSLLASRKESTRSRATVRCASALLYASLVRDPRASRRHLIDRRAHDAPAFLIVCLRAEVRDENAEAFSAERCGVEGVDESRDALSFENVSRRVGRVRADRRVEADREIGHRARDRPAHVL